MTPTSTSLGVAVGMDVHAGRLFGPVLRTPWPSLVYELPYAVVPNGKEVWAGSNTNGTVSIVDVATGAIVDTLTGFSLPYRLAISADGRTAMICDPQANKVHVADVAQRKVIWSLEGLGSPRGVTISPDGKTAFVTLNSDRTVAVVDLTTRTILRKIGVGASPDGVGFGPAF